MPEVSVIIPVYNAEKYIKDCVRSILRQSFEDFEVIIVNDGSKDKSQEICENLVCMDSRLRLIEQENEGVSAARNRGKNIANGEYIIFIDADDVLHPCMLESLLLQAKKTDSDISVCAVNKVKEGSREIDKIEKASFEVWSTEEALIYLFQGVKIESGVWNKLFHRSVVSEISFYEGKKINEDKYFLFKTLLKVDKVVFTPARLYDYIQREDSVTKQAFSERWFDILFFSERMYYETIQCFPQLELIARFQLLQANYTVLRKTFPFRKIHNDIYQHIYNDIKRIKIKGIEKYLSKQQLFGIYCIKYFWPGYVLMRMISMNS